MSEGQPDKLEWVTGSITLTLGGQPVEMKMTLPSTPVHPGALLPVFQEMTMSFVGMGVSAAEAEGRSVSCKAGCGACCRQPVPISELEARQLSDLVAAMPEPRQSRIRQRFAEALEKLAAAGLLDKLREPDRYPDEATKDMGLAYFRQGIPCPFLEDESCSIHPDRPLICREYLVTSDPAQCADPRADRVDAVALPGKMSHAVFRLSKQTSSRFIPYVPMILLLEWVASHPDEMEKAPGPEIVRRVLQNMAEKKPEGT